MKRAENAISANEFVSEVFKKNKQTSQNFVYFNIFVKMISFAIKYLAIFDDIANFSSFNSSFHAGTIYMASDLFFSGPNN